MNKLQRTRSVYTSYYRRQGTFNSLFKSEDKVSNNEKYGAMKDDGDLSEDEDFDDIPQKNVQDNANNGKDPLV